MEFDLGDFPLFVLTDEELSRFGKGTLPIENSEGFDVFPNGSGQGNIELFERFPGLLEDGSLGG